MATETTMLFGRLEVLVADGRGRPVWRGTYRNQVVRGGRGVVAGLLCGVTTIQAIQVAIGRDGRRPTDDAQTELFEPVALVEAERPRVAEDRVLVGAQYKATDNVTIGESGLVLLVRGTGDRRAVPVLYNRVVLNPAAELRKDDTLTLTWTLGFTSVG